MCSSEISNVNTVNLLLFARTLFSLIKRKKKVHTKIVIYSSRKLHYKIILVSVLLMPKWLNFQSTPHSHQRFLYSRTFHPECETFLYAYPTCSVLERWKVNLSSWPWPSSMTSGMFSTSSVRSRWFSSTTKARSLEPITGAETFRSSRERRCGSRGDRPGLNFGEGTGK